VRHPPDTGHGTGHLDGHRAGGDGDLGNLAQGWPEPRGSPRMAANSAIRRRRSATVTAPPDSAASNR